MRHTGQLAGEVIPQRKAFGFDKPVIPGDIKAAGAPLKWQRRRVWMV